MSKQQCSYCRSVDYPHAESKKIRLGQSDIPEVPNFFKRRKDNKGWI